jgi:hypothetical protein
MEDGSNPDSLDNINLRQIGTSRSKETEGIPSVMRKQSNPQAQPN